MTHIPFLNAQISNRTDEDKTLHVVEVTKSTMETALDERRLKYEVGS